MKIEKRPAWRNQKCSECGKAIYQSKKNNQMYECSPDSLTDFKKWKLCINCFKEIFSEKVKKMLK